MPECKYELITPKQAQQWLDLNHRNRSLSSAAINRLAGAITRGEWMSDSTDAIGLDTEGGVVNGQHRLSAIIQANMPVEMLVAKGVSPEVIKVIDQGHSRSFSQWLALDGRYSQPTQLATAVTWLYRMIENLEPRYPEMHRATVPQLLALLDQHKNIEMSIETVRPVVERIKKLHQGFLAAWHYAMASVDPEQADEFFAELATGEGVTETDPVYVLREKYQTNAAAAESRKAPTGDLIAWLTKAWNATASGETVTSKGLSWKKSGRSPELFPKIAGLPWLNPGDAEALA